MHYMVTHLSNLRVPPEHTADCALLECTASNFPTSVLEAVGIQPHYKEVGTNQFDDLLYDLPRSDFTRLGAIRVYFKSEDTLSFCEDLNWVLNYMDSLSHHLSRNGLNGKCELIIDFRDGESA